MVLQSVFFSRVVSSLGLDLGDSVDTSLDVDLVISDLSFSSQNVVGSDCYKYVRGYKHLWALRNPIEDFGLNFFYWN